MAPDFELQVLAELSDIKAVGTATAQRIESLENRLFDGPSSVVSNLQADIAEIKEDRIREAKTAQIHRWISHSAGPVIVFGHTILRHFGIDV